jgi:(p)ppGpp synthase/HD superfamily hydrolase
MTFNLRISEALQLAKIAHHGQYDKLGVEYIEHVKAVAQAVRHLGEKTKSYACFTIV